MISVEESGLNISGRNMTDADPEKILESSVEKSLPPSPKDPKEIFSSRKHSMDYVTVNGVVLRTGYANKADWYLLCIKELLDNAIDFLWKNYQGTSDATTITVDITKDDSSFHIKVRNTNSKNVPVFQNLSAIFDYDMRYGSKQNQHIVSRGMLGDAMKQILAWPYVLIHTKDDGSAFADRQWDKPLVIRSNKTERQIFLRVDKANQVIEATPIKESILELPNTDTEIETIWPIIDGVSLDVRKIEEFCKQYTIFTTDISFRFLLTDNGRDKGDSENNDNDCYDNEDEDYTSIISKRKSDGLTSELVDVISSPARKATIKIDAPRLHSISKGWNNISSVHSYKPEEFVAAITSVHDKDNTSVYDVLRTFREGTQSPKTAATQISIGELLSDPERDKKIERLYYALKKVLPPPNRLSLPYSNIKSEERKRTLVERIAQIYGSNNLDSKKAIYKVIHDIFNDDNLRQILDHDGKTYTYERGKGILHFPFAIEIIAIPFSNGLIENSEDQGTRFIGSVNYSISPRGNKFDGEYEWNDKNKKSYGMRANNITAIFNRYNFEFWRTAESKTKLPCIIVANLICPRIDYHGHDKSRIDTQPFAKGIIEAARKIAEEVQTFKAAGYVFYKKHQRTFAPQYNQLTARQALKGFLKKRKEEVFGY